MIDIDSIRASLIEQLQSHGADVDLYRGLIDDYCFFAEQLQEMRTDIEKRGRSYKAISSTGKPYDKDNPSVVNALRYSQQMIKILQSMGLRLDTVATKKDDKKEEDLGL